MAQKDCLEEFKLLSASCSEEDCASMCEFIREEAEHGVGYIAIRLRPFISREKPLLDSSSVAKKSGAIATRICCMSEVELDFYLMSIKVANKVFQVKSAKRFSFKALFGRQKTRS